MWCSLERLDGSSNCVCIVTGAVYEDIVLEMPYGETGKSNLEMPYGETGKSNCV